MEISLRDIKNLKRILRLFFGECCQLVEFFPRSIMASSVLVIYYRAGICSSVLEDGAVRLVNSYFKVEIVKETKSYGTAQDGRRFRIYFKKEVSVPEYFYMVHSL